MCLRAFRLAREVECCDALEWRWGCVLAERAGVLVLGCRLAFCAHSELVFLSPRTQPPSTLIWPNTAMSAAAGGKRLIVIGGSVLDVQACIARCARGVRAVFG